MSKTFMWVPLIALLACGLASGAEMVVNGGFAEPIFDPGPGGCDAVAYKNTDPITSWNVTKGGVAAPLRNDNICGNPWCGEDSAHVSLIQNRRASQELVGMTPDTTYVVTGSWNIWNAESRWTSATCEILMGDPVTGQSLNAVTVQYVSTCTSAWVPFSYEFTTPATITGPIYLNIINFDTFNPGSSCCFFGTHVDWVSVATDGVVVTVDDVDPVQIGVRDSSLAFPVTGSGFDAGTLSVKLATEFAEIAGVASNITATSFTATFDLTAAEIGLYNLVVDVDGTQAADTDAAHIVLPAFSNGNFEADGVTQCVASDIHPTDWITREISGWGFSNRMTHNGYIEEAEVPIALDWYPTCPAEGDSYATKATHSVNSNIASWSYQTFAVTNGKTYTMSGLFAGSGSLDVGLELLDGPVSHELEPTTLLNRANIQSGEETFDWRFGFVQAQAVSDFMTVRWIAQGTGADGKQATHADDLKLEECVGADQPTLTQNTIDPASSTNNGILNNVIISGVNLNSSAVVMLSAAGTTITATSVTSPNASKLECQFDLTGVRTGWYDVVVKQGGCVSMLEDEFLVLGTTLENGEFELPAAPQVCDHVGDGTGHSLFIAGVPTSWNAEGEMGRDNSVHGPECPRIDTGEANHYASMTGSAGDTRRAYQTVKVEKQLDHVFSGFFSFTESTPSVDTIVRIALIDGTIKAGAIDGTLIAETVMPADAAWTEYSVQGSSLSGVMTIVWEVVNSTSVFGAHGDSFTFTPVGPACSNPFADADGDGDVDQDDFGSLQRCITGQNGGIPRDGDLAICRCYNTNADDGIDQSDVAAFNACATGPDVIFDLENVPAGCVLP